MGAYGTASLLHLGERQMAQDKQSSVEPLQIENSQDLDSSLLDQALDMFLNDQFPSSPFLGPVLQLPPELNAQCIAGIPDSNTQDRTVAGMMQRIDELCRCVMMIPPGQKSLFPDLLICDIASSFRKRV